MRDLLVASVVFGLLPFVFKRPFWGILLSCWLGYMNPHLLCYGFMPTMPVVQIVAVVTLIGILVSKEEKRMVWSREVIVLLIFVAWMGVTTLYALYPAQAEVQYIKVIKIQILTFMALLLLTSREKVTLFVWVVALSLAFYGVKGGIFTILNGGAYRVNGPGGFIGGNNEIALALVMTIPLLRYLQLQEKRLWLRSGLSVVMLLTAIAAIGSQSRGALLGLALTGAIFWVKSRKKLATGILIVVAVLVISSIMPEQWYARMNTIETYEEDASALGRINAWWTAWNMAKDRVTGGGFESFQWNTFQIYAPEHWRVHDSHSIYFQIMGHHGFIGLSIFLMLLLLTWRKCGHISALAKRRPEMKWASDLAAMIQVSMVGYLSAGAFLGLGYFDYIYHLIALAVVVHQIVASGIAAVAPAGPVLASADGLRGAATAGRRGEAG